MMRGILIKRICVFIILGLLLCLSGCHCPESKTLKNSMLQSVNGTRIELHSCTDFEWDTVRIYFRALDDVNGIPAPVVSLIRDWNHGKQYDFTDYLSYAVFFQHDVVVSCEAYNSLTDATIVDESGTPLHYCELDVHNATFFVHVDSDGRRYWAVTDSD